MCGIAGFTSKKFLKKDKAETVLNRMCFSLRHRGPDDHGSYFYGFDGKKNINTALGHNRLSIIDLSMAGHQPMTNESGTLWVVYNGEIYNFLEIKEELILKGHKFHSRADTEIIIHGFEEWGERCLNKFNGMFSFALWDEKNEILFMARDRMGKKPLYYSEFEDNFIFASEPKAILQFPDFQKEIDSLSLKKYLLYEYVPSPHTIYKNIKRIESGNFVFVKDNRIISSRKYWNISFEKKVSANPQAELKDVLKESVRKRLISDVPLGVFLSGGIDSSAVCALMAEIIPPNDIKTFTIGFEEKSFNEAGFAKDLASYLKTDHHEKILNPKAMLEILPEVIDFLDEPFADASIIPTYLLSKFTREYVTVALGGDGGDELFAGYETFQAHKLARIYEKLPRLVKIILANFINRLPVSLENMSFDFRLKQFLKGIPHDIPLRNQVWLGSFSFEEQKGFILDKEADRFASDMLFEDIFVKLKDCTAENYLDLVSYLYLKFYLQDDILTKVDRASMAVSLEVRAPILDYKAVEFAMSIPPGQRLHNFTSKYIFKKMLGEVLPGNIIKRPKKGFGIPVAKWINGDLKKTFDKELSYEKIEKEGIFNPGLIRAILQEHHSGLKDNRKRLWTIFMFELWFKKWMKN